MKKAIQFKDVLGNTIQFKTAVDTFRQLESKPCWIVESRKIFPQTTRWVRFQVLENQYFETDAEAQNAIKKHISEYAEKAQKLGKRKIQFEEVLL